MAKASMMFMLTLKLAMEKVSFVVASNAECGIAGN